MREQGLQSFIVDIEGDIHDGRTESALLDGDVDQFIVLLERNNWTAEGKGKKKRWVKDNGSLRLTKDEENNPLVEWEAIMVSKKVV